MKKKIIKKIFQNLNNEGFINYFSEKEKVDEKKLQESLKELMDESNINKDKNNKEKENDKEKEKEKEKQTLNEKKEIEKMFRNIKNIKKSQNKEKKNKDDNKFYL